MRDINVVYEKNNQKTAIYELPILVISLYNNLQCGPRITHNIAGPPA